jgi:hypothetical protein
MGAGCTTVGMQGILLLSFSSRHSFGGWSRNSAAGSFRQHGPDGPGRGTKPLPRWMTVDAN